MSRSTTVAVGVVLLALAGVLGGAGTWAAFDDSSVSSGNQVRAGTVAIADDDGGSAMLGFSDAQPGTTDSSCITISYTGTLAATVRLYGATSGSGLAAYLDLRVTRGSFAGPKPAFRSCVGFQPDAADHAGAGPGVVYDGTVEGYPDSYAAGRVDPSPTAPESWEAGESHVYRFEVTLRDDAAATGKNATQSFSWEPRNR